MQVGETAPRLRSARIWSWGVGVASYPVILAVTWYYQGPMPTDVAVVAAVAGAVLAAWVGWMVRLYLTSRRLFFFSLPALAATTMILRAPEQRLLGLFLLTAYLAWLQVSTEERKGES
jgi:hypothetical protein